MTKLEQCLREGSGPGLLDAIIIPSALWNRTVPEQIEFVTKALQDEISVEGIQMLKRQAKFGALEEMFPQEGLTWATQAGVLAEDCVAFRMDQKSLRTEVVLVSLSTKNSRPTDYPNSSQTEANYRLVRCNNVIRAQDH